MTNPSASHRPPTSTPPPHQRCAHQHCARIPPYRPVPESTLCAAKMKQTHLPLGECGLYLAVPVSPRSDNNETMMLHAQPVQKKLRFCSHHEHRHFLLFCLLF